MDKNALLAQFGKLLMEEVRDTVLEINNSTIKGERNSEENQELYKLIKNFNEPQQEIVKKFVRKSIDSTLHHFLWIIEQYEEYDLVAYEEGQTKPVSLREVSEMLCAELYGEDGWITQHSKYPPSIT